MIAGKLYNKDSLINDYMKAHKDATVRTAEWQVRKMTEDGTLERVGRGLYRLTQGSPLLIDVDDTMKSLDSEIMESLPAIRHCLWPLSVTNSLSQHLHNLHIYILDVERIALEAAYHHVRSSHPNTILSKDLYDDLSAFDGYVLIRPLVTDAPIQKENGVFVAAIEKILVDLAIDKEFVSFQGNEIHHIFENAQKSHPVNLQRMLRYAGRRNHKREISELIDATK